MDGLTLWADGGLGHACSPAARAEVVALTAHDPRRPLVLCHLSAAWIHIGGVRPPVAHTCPRPGGSARGTHRYVLQPGDVERIGSVDVTTRGRTLFDLVRTDDATHVGVARALMRETDGSAGRARRTAELVAHVAAICARSVPGSTRARRVVDMLAASIE